MRSTSVFDPVPMRHIPLRHLGAALVLFSATAVAFAQDIENGRRLSERLCAACHAIDAKPTKFNRAPPLMAIAARQDVNLDMITSFLLLPHATMPNVPMSRNNAVDIAAFIMDMRK